MQDAARNRFDRIADNYANSEVHASSPTLQQLSELVGDRTDLEVCDVGCAAGHTAFVFAGRARTVVGVDPSPTMLGNFRTLARSKGLEVEAVEAFAESIPLASDRFDYVTCRLASHHFSDIDAAMAELRRITKPGGRVVIIDLHGDDDPELDGLNHQLEVLHDPTHVRSYTIARWRELFGRAGLEIVHLERDVSERPSGVPLSRWCEIASSGAAAHAALVTLLEHTDPARHEAIGVRRGPSEYMVPVRTCIIMGEKPR
ncbi:class I SAM-dependent methyltransferase [Paraliomyxa miuraensis]|uniref:class I SAM-dependent methyltransferase n=1 Tax=Paraliomyxa miuraensis TaxID=376150 RepID=UPI00225C0572|nr:class I SAM-dependent methyltransferase [Paraliomyxa miuraensis]MCX4242446.1 class I SAM-dependent methyltransferase [Paraliomyxa miuraensis]